MRRLLVGLITLLLLGGCSSSTPQGCGSTTASWKLEWIPTGTGQQPYSSVRTFSQWIRGVTVHYDGGVAFVKVRQRGDSMVLVVEEDGEEAQVRLAQEDGVCRWVRRETGKTYLFYALAEESVDND